MTQPNEQIQEPREFWIDDILNVDRPSEKTAYVHEQDTEKCHRVIHVIEFEAYRKAVEALKEIAKDTYEANPWTVVDTMSARKAKETLRELGVEFEA